MTNLAILGAMEDLIQFIVFAAIIVLSLLGKLINTAAEKKQVQQRRVAPPPPKNDDPLTAEIDEFLGRVGRGEPTSAPAQGTGEVVVAAEVVDPLSVEEQVRRDLGSEDHFSKRVSPHLGEQVEHADEGMNAHVHDVFDHQVGRLTDMESTTEAVTSELASSLPAGAAGLAAMLADPDSLQRAILISEVLQRPEHRWG